jgi:hypothetical protein
MAASTAMDLVIEARRSPRQLTKLSRGEPLTEMLEVIRCAAGDEATISQVTARHDLPSHELQELARTFLQNMITLSDGKDHRVLGLSPQAEPALLREHKRWLLRWLHPDINHSKWESALFAKVSAAADRLAKEATIPPVERAAAAPVVPPRKKTPRSTSRFTKLPVKRRHLVSAVIRLATIPALLVGAVLLIIVVVLGRSG